MSDDMTDDSPATTISRTDFARQNPHRQRRIALDGFPKIVNDLPPPPVILTEGQISRQDFDALSQADRRRVVADRMKIVDL